LVSPSSAAQNSFRAIDLIRKKRDGGALTDAEISFLIAGCTDGSIPDYQMAAWLMAAVLHGMTRQETAALTHAMLHSGEVLDLSALPATKVDKHSTGGVGDKTSLILAPLIAAGGLYVPMISGRGLGHTGGTLDKLESIAGFRVGLPVGDFQRILRACGVCMIGQTEKVAPADRKLYALRDVTGTVESPYLICASIMSKKLAEGTDALVLDVKTGSGAFMKKEDDAVFLAELMVETGERMGKKIAALITDMNQPLGRMVGNAMEVQECIDIMHDGGPADLRELTLELAAWMFLLGEKVKTVQEGRELSATIIASGEAFRRFRQMVELQGGDVSMIDDPTRLPHADHRVEVTSRTAGFVIAINCEQVGTACVVLGGGREKKEDSVDPAVGFVVHKKIGDKVSEGESLCTIHCHSDEQAKRARELLEESYQIAAAPPAKAMPLVHRVIYKGEH
jgi:pyrimidine-nucleoside phosphorylase